LTEPPETPTNPIPADQRSNASEGTQRLLNSQSKPERPYHSIERADPEDSDPSSSEGSISDLPSTRSRRSKTRHSKIYRSATKGDVAKLVDGLNPRFSAWKKLMINKFRGNRHQFHSEQSKMAYVFDRTEGKAQELLDPQYMSDRLDSFQTARAMIEFLERCFTNFQEVEDAQDEFDEMFMTSIETFQDFRTRFLQAANLAGVPLATQQSAIFRKIKKELQWDLFTEKSTWTSLDQACNRINIVDKTRRQLIDRLGTRYRNKDEPRHSSSSRPTTMVRSAPAPAAHRSRTPGLLELGDKTSAIPRSTPDRSTPKPPLTCWNCGKSGHTSSYCIEPRKADVHEIDKEDRIEELLSDSDSDSEDSGKEQS